MSTSRRSGWQRQGKPTASSQVARTYQWQRTRRRILRRDDGECQIRGPRCLVDATEVDKITPISLGGCDTDEDNLRAVCVPCHRSKTAREAAAAGVAARARRSGKRPPRTHPSDVLLGDA
ncbi:HNH endonuclease signature motif containing protein [Mycobacterium sp. 94-17]|nr:HNH endonuclease signature motif containing protein [Mycobacterium sp. 94-17]